MILSTNSCELSEQFWKVIEFLKLEQVVLTRPRSDLPQNRSDVISQIVLSEYEGVTTNSLKHELAKNRYNHDLIVVVPRTPGIASIAARDGRVDIVRIDPQSSLSVFNTRYGRRLAEYGKLVEIDLSFIMDKHIASKLRPVMRVLSALKVVPLTYVLSSQPNNPEEIRSYRGLQAIGRLIGLNNNVTDPRKLIQRVERNRKKIAGIEPLPGVEITKW